ncbi:DUF222 domain-containing protein [Arthrobacter jiangjiafuii]|uniref:DUF222 domain-containing protein n=1 Tax=Arthrobacter jiangjiafuii TaxID=2817475 RepID=UPI001F212909|nr:DUF222 domain-containing protein [Arthrobacter jiangjiafuii]
MYETTAGTATRASAPEGPDTAVLSGLIDQVRALEELKAAASAAQVRVTAVVDALTRRAQAAAGVKADQLGKGVGAQIGLARRESPHRGTRMLGTARVLTREMPHTLHALALGVISEWRATILVKETACLSLEDRQRIDEQVAGNLAELETLGDNQLIARIKTLSYALDPHSVVNRASKAASERYVSCRPAPDTMTGCCRLPRAWACSRRSRGKRTGCGRPGIPAPRARSWPTLWWSGSPAGRRRRMCGFRCSW